MGILCLNQGGGAPRMEVVDFISVEVWGSCVLHYFHRCLFSNSVAKVRKDGISCDAACKVIYICLRYDKRKGARPTDGAPMFSESMSANAL